MLATVKATAWRLRDRLAERGALVDVVLDVVEHGLAGADGHRAPAEARELDALLVVRLGHQRAGDCRSRISRPVPAARRPIAGSGSTSGRPSPDSTMNSDGPRSSSSAATMNSSPSAGARDERLDAVEHVAAVRLAGRGLKLERVEQRPRLEDRQRGGRDALAHELGQVGRLLLGVAPQADRGGDGGRGQAGDGDAHVALRPAPRSGAPR